MSKLGTRTDKIVDQLLATNLHDLTFSSSSQSRRIFDQKFVTRTNDNPASMKCYFRQNNILEIFPLAAVLNEELITWASNDRQFAGNH